jgi:hypothetical protein
MDLHIKPKYTGQGPMQPDTFFNTQYSQLTN